MGGMDEVGGIDRMDTTGATCRIIGNNKTGTMRAMTRDDFI